MREFTPEEKELIVNTPITIDSFDFNNEIIKIEKIKMQRTRFANNDVLKFAVDFYNKTHDDSELRLTDYGIVQVRKCSITN